MLDALDRRRRRPLPSGLGPPSLDPLAPPRAAPSGVEWLEPVPDHLVIDERGTPWDIVIARQGVRLALVAGLQLLPPRQRAAFVLCDVLALGFGGGRGAWRVCPRVEEPAPDRARAQLVKHLQATRTWRSRLTRVPAASWTAT